MKNSGLIFSLKNDGSAAIGFEDYNVETIDHSNYECMYYLDAPNFSKFLKSLDIPFDSNIKANLIEEFGSKFDSSKFEQHCNDKDIEYNRHICISGF